jgi:hypothetical protein
LDIIPYQTKAKKVAGTNLGEVYENASRIYREIASRSKRRPYVRSTYFKKEKIFFDYFWDHLRQKLPKERFRRLKYFKASIELIKNSKNQPVLKENIDKKGILYRFSGLTAEKETFFVQIKEDKKKKKYFMSCFEQK